MAGRPPASAAPSGIPCPPGPMCMRGCGSPAGQTPGWTPGTPCRANVSASDCPGAAAGFASYGNQIGLATGLVRGNLSPRLHGQAPGGGAVLGREGCPCAQGGRPAPGDAVILVGGKTGRDGRGGATGSSCAPHGGIGGCLRGPGAKGQRAGGKEAPRLFLNPDVSRLIKRCNDFGAGGVSVAIGELAPGLLIDLDQVPVKYQGLDGTELAISESQERMAVVVDAGTRRPSSRCRRLKTWRPPWWPVVTEEPRLVMNWRGEKIVDISGLDSNGARKQMNITIERPESIESVNEGSFQRAADGSGGGPERLLPEGPGERFDSTIGTGTVLYPFGGKNQLTPPCATWCTICRCPAARTPAPSWPLAITRTFQKKALITVPTWPSPIVSRLVAAGTPFDSVYLSHQEFFPKPGRDAKRWACPWPPLLGAAIAQMELRRGHWRQGLQRAAALSSRTCPHPDFLGWAMAAPITRCPRSSRKQAAGFVGCVPGWGRTGFRRRPCGKPLADGGRPAEREKALSCQAVGFGGAAHAVMMMAIGNGIGFVLRKLAGKGTVQLCLWLPDPSWRKGKWQGNCWA